MVVLRLWIISSLMCVTSDEPRAVMVNEHLAAVIGGVAAFDVTEIFQAVDQPRGGGRGVAHSGGDLGHRQCFAPAQRAEQKELREKKRCRRRVRAKGWSGNSAGDTGGCPLVRPYPPRTAGSGRGASVEGEGFVVFKQGGQRRVNDLKYQFL